MVTQADNKLGAAIDRTLQYYALFRYPLQVPDIRRHCGVMCSDEDIFHYLSGPQAQDKIYCLDGYYSSLPDIAALLERRIQGNEHAARDMPGAGRVGRLIYQFPFIRFVGISGSLSKGYSDHQADFDFFIVTQKDRLWISRTLLHLFKKMTFIAGQQHKFCMNYFIDGSALLLEERNIYTATELSSLVPVCGTDTYRRLMLANSWVTHLLPNYKPGAALSLHDKNGPVKKILSGIISLMNPAGLNRFLMRLTDKKWRKKWAAKGYPAEDYDLAFKTTLHISKNHPANYQKRILAALTRKDP